MARQHNGKRWALGFGVTVAIAGAAGWVMSTTLVRGADAGNKVASIVSALVALGGFALTLFSTLSRTPSGSDETSSLVEEASRQLADNVRSLSAREEEHRRIGDPRPLSVQWDTASEDVGDRWENIHGTAGQDRDEPMSLAGGFTSIRETYEAVPSGRLVILGRAGAGKTVLAHRLILALLDEQDRTCPVPVLFSLSDWDPATLGLRDWMVRQLVRDFPFLDAREPTGKSRAQLLVEADRILPVLDGFDEIPARHHPDAIDGISRFRGQLVVTSRPDEYANAARAVRPLSSAAAIELADLTLDETRRYLQASTNKTRTAEWNAVFDHLRTAPDTAASHNLTPVLTTPLMVMLARTTYNDTQRDPQELLNTTRFPTRAALEERLLDKTLTTLYDPRHTTQRPGEPASPKYDPDRARHWLGYLATHLTKRNTHDLSWWHLPNSLPRHTRILTTTTTLTLALGLAGGFVGMLDNWPTFDLTGLVWALNYGFASGVATVLTVGVAVGTVIGFINELEVSRSRMGREPERLRLRLRRRDRTYRSGITSPKQAVSDFAVGLTIGFAVGLTVGLAREFTFILRSSFFFGEDVCSYMYGFARFLAFTPLSGLAVGFAFGLVNVVVSVFGDNHDPHGAITPWQLLTTDRTVTLVRNIATVLMIALVYGLALWLTGRLVDGYGGRLEDGFTVGLFGIVVGGVRLGLSAWGRWLMFARLWLPLTRRLPWRPKRFLEDAYHRGVLRQAGAVYQFRHAQLRDHLANQYRNQPSTTSPAEASAHDGLSPASEPH